MALLRSALRRFALLHKVETISQLDIDMEKGIYKHNAGSSMDKAKNPIMERQTEFVYET